MTRPRFIRMDGWMIIIITMKSHSGNSHSKFTRIGLDSRMHQVVQKKYLPLFRWSMPHLFSLLAGDSCSPKMQTWLESLFSAQLQGIPFFIFKKNVTMGSIRSTRTDQHWRGADAGGNWEADENLAKQKEWTPRSYYLLFWWCCQKYISL